MEAIYFKEAKFKTLEFFSFPKNYNYQYGEYGIYLARSKEYFESRSFYPKHGYEKYAPSMMIKELK